MWVNRWGLGARLAICACAGLSSGCSLLFVKSPPKSGRPAAQSAEPDVKCTTSQAAPVIDLLIAGFQTVRTVVAVNSSESDYVGAPISRSADIAIGLGLTALFVGSSSYGFSKTSACQRAKAAQAKLREERPPNEPATRREVSEPVTKSRRPRAQAPPKVTGGFEIGSSVDDAQTACESAGNEWSSVDASSFRCSGTVKSVGAPARAELGFCGERLCRIVVLADPELERILPTRAFLRARDQLEERYGPPVEQHYNVDVECRDEPSLQECFSHGRAKAFAEWHFSTGQRLRLKLELEQLLPEAPRKVIFRLENTAPESEAASVQSAPGGPPLCVPGQTIACAGPGSCSGYQVCAEDGRRYLPCQCE